MSHKPQEGWIYLDGEIAEYDASLQILGLAGQLAAVGADDFARR